jgi:hypothetical protein
MYPFTAESAMRPALDVGLGTDMYLKTLRTTFFVFLACTLLAVPLLFAYTSSDARDVVFSASAALDWLAATTSVNHATSRSWTPGGENYCSGRGFAALVCLDGGWGPPGSVADFACGAGGLITYANVTPLSQRPFALGGSLFDSPLACSRAATLCYCQPGWAGARCETRAAGGGGGGVWLAMRIAAGGNATMLLVPAPEAPANASAAGGGWCAPAPPAAAAAPAPECSLRGTCGVTAAGVGFCRCDEGWFGPTCNHSDAGGGSEAPPRFGPLPADVLLSPAGELAQMVTRGSRVAATACTLGGAPRIMQRSALLRVLDARCSLHGFAAPVEPASGTGRLGAASNYYRPFTPGVCWCEPGFAGEECLGGGPLPVASGSIATSVALVLAVGVNVLYRSRKRADVAYDATHLTPSDFSLFVDGLPSLNAKRAGEVVEHFSAWGPVHSVAPAPDDEWLRHLQEKKNEALRRLQIFMELDEHAHRQEGAAAAARARGASPREAAAAVARVPPVRLPPFHRAHPLRTLAEVQPMHPLLMAAFYVPGVRNVLLGSRPTLEAYIRALNAKISVQLRLPQTQRFNRAFVTFEFAAHAEAALADHSATSAAGPCARPRLLPPRCLFWRKHELRVARAPEPGEVLWDSLDTGVRMRRARACVSAALLVGLLLLVAFVFSSLPADPTGFFVPALVVAVSQASGVLWEVASHYLEQPVSSGEKSRSIFFKTLATQLAVMAVSNVGNFGLPWDSQNGAHMDFFANAGAFMLRVAVVEAVLPPALAAAAVDTRAFRFLWGASGSAALREWVSEAPPFSLEARCASLMRVVLMCCVFSPGVPLLLPTTALCIGLQWVVDGRMLRSLYRVQRTGVHLARAIELVLLAGVVLNLLAALFILRSVTLDSVPLELEVAFLLVLGVGGWAVSGYMSWKVARARDCCCGAGPCCVGALTCWSPRVMAPVNALHAAFMRAVLGANFFVLRHEVGGADDSGGTTFSAAAAGPAADATGLRVHPYAVWERAQLGAWGSTNAVAEPPPPRSALDIANAAAAAAAASADADATAAPEGALVHSPLFNPDVLYHLPLGRRRET